MAEQKKDKDNSGVAFWNTFKTKPTQPDINGKCTVGGKDWDMVIWENVSAEGKKYFTIKFNEPKVGTDKKEPYDNKQTFSKPIQHQPTATSISDDLSEMEAILKSADDDDSPFD